MFKAWEWNGDAWKCDAVFLPSFVVAKREERNARHGIFFTLKNAFFPVYVWYLGRATCLPPTSESIAGVNVDYVRRLCICADLYVYSRVSTANTCASNFLLTSPFAFFFPGVPDTFAIDLNRFFLLWLRPRRDIGGDKNVNRRLRIRHLNCRSLRSVFLWL